MKRMFLAAAVGAATATGAALAETPKLTMDEMMVLGSEPGIEIYVRSKRPADMNSSQTPSSISMIDNWTC